MTMQGFVQKLKEPCGLLRIGATYRGQPFIYSITYTLDELDPRYVEIVGLYRKGLSLQESRYIVAKINEAVPTHLVSYERFVYDNPDNAPIRTVQIDPGLIGGRIRMKTELADVGAAPRAPKNRHGDLPVLSEARNADGTFNEAILKAGLDAWMNALFGANPTHQIVNGSEMRVDWDNDVLVIVRQKLPTAKKAS